MSAKLQIRVLCAMAEISESELSRRLGKSKQAFSSKMIRGRFTADELEKLAKAAGAKLEAHYVFPDGRSIPVL